MLNQILCVFVIATLASSSALKCYTCIGEDPKASWCNKDIGNNAHVVNCNRAADLISDIVSSTSTRTTSINATSIINNLNAVIQKVHVQAEDPIMSFECVTVGVKITDPTGTAMEPKVRTCVPKIENLCAGLKTQGITTCKTCSGNLCNSSGIVNVSIALLAFAAIFKMLL